MIPQVGVTLLEHLFCPLMTRITQTATVFEVPMSRVIIKELRLRNYRAFADARLVLDDVTFLVGRNGAGKSTLMDAFSFISEAVTDSLGTALERRGNLEGILRKQPRRGSRSDVAVAVRFELQELDQTFPVLYGFAVGTERARSNFIVKEEFFRTVIFTP